MAVDRHLSVGSSSSSHCLVTTHVRAARSFLARGGLPPVTVLVRARYPEDLPE